MTNLTGVYKAKKKNGKTYYRASITHKGKHISLGSFYEKDPAHKAYILAKKILTGPKVFLVEEYSGKNPLSFHKWVVLINYRDNGIYFKNPIYPLENYFLYYLTTKETLKFDIDDLFYYSNHKILRRGGYLFVSDYGMQVNILSRYGIKSHAIAGKDYLFMNRDSTDYRYSNVKVINPYYGVSREIKKGQVFYLCKINVYGDYIVGRYSNEIEAAIAYNKAAHILNSKGLKKDFRQNYISNIDEIKYAILYQRIRISKKILALTIL